MNTYLTMDKAASTTQVTTCAEESGWSAYLEGFPSDNEGSFYSSLDGSSMISDAASGAAWKFLQDNRLPKGSASGPKIPRKVNVKKPRAKEISQDDSLEDTASSPVNSPKVGISHPTDTVCRKTDEHSTSHGAKGIFASQMQIEDSSENPKGRDINCQGLKKRGLCLVPMSMLVNYYR